MDSVFINSIRSIRVLNSIVHFELGEDRPANNTIESSVSFKAAMSEKDFIEMVNFLSGFIGQAQQKSDNVTGNQKNIVNQTPKQERKKVKISSSSDVHI
ncbi:hypothetical protein HN615_08540 [Candidatus Woesearchaeota archaeon]|jgi:hypothetical protein|nr:hypothetical protein [Candidatus Woesearchaeota archaeon]